MKFLDVIGGIVSPVTTLIDKLHTSKEEKMLIEKAVFETQANLAMQVLDYEKQLLDSQKSIIVAEAQGQSFLQRSWRPITMLTFLALVCLDSFGVLANDLAPEAWVLLQLGLGGYVAGRSLEKVAPHIKDAFKK